MRIAVPIYAVGVALLVAVALFGTVKQGRAALAQRRRRHPAVRIHEDRHAADAGVVLPAARRASCAALDFAIAGLILLVIPVALIAKQPDLGTALLVLVGRLLRDLPGRPVVEADRGLAALCRVMGAASLPVVWSLLHDYQRERVLTLLDPTSDPLGKGFHIIQSTIAVGSGGITGKGWIHGTQAHLEFIPERTTDFIFAVFSEEFGLIGNLVLLLLYLLLIGRGLMIAAEAPQLLHAPAGRRASR